MIKTFFSSILCLICFLPKTSTSQNHQAKAETYFGNYLSKNKMNELILRSLPTLADSKKIFKTEEDAKQFMLLVDALGSKMKEQKTGDDEVFPKLEVNTFTLNDIKEGQAHYNIGLLRIIDKFAPTVRFYSVRFLKESEFENGFSYIYWMFVNNKWVFISKPQQAFKSK